MSTQDQPTGCADACGMVRLRRLQLLLLFILLALAVVGRRSALWPLVTWPVYSKTRPVRPAEYSLREVRAWTISGQQHSFRHMELVEGSRFKIADLALKSAERVEPQYADYLESLVRRATPEDIQRLEVWQSAWRVRPRRVPPVDAERPVREQRLVDFAVSTNGGP